MSLYSNKRFLSNMKSKINTMLSPNSKRLKQMDSDDDFTPSDLGGRKGNAVPMYRHGDESGNCSGPSTKWVGKTSGTPIKIDAVCTHCMNSFESYTTFLTHDLTCFYLNMMAQEENKLNIPGYEEWYERSQSHAFACVYCKQGFALFQEYRNHLKSHLDGYVMSCKLCSENFLSTEDCNEHLLDKHKIDPWSETKRTSFLGAIVKLEHSKVVDKVLDQTIGHQTVVKKERDLDADYVNYSNDEHDAHGVYFRERPGGFSCAYDPPCEGNFIEERYAHMHQPCYKPKAKTSWQCPRDGCSKSCLNKFVLLQHLASHFAKRWICSYCDHAFCLEPQAKGHLRLHGKLSGVSRMRETCVTIR